MFVLQCTSPSTSAGIRKAAGGRFYARNDLVGDHSRLIIAVLVEVCMGSKICDFVKIGSVLVHPDILSRPYTCDVQKYGCASLCCYRSCIVPEQEAQRIEKHLDDILCYLAPENREAIRENGSVLAICSQQCPSGCAIHEDEARAMQRKFNGQGFRCILLHNNECALLYTTPEGMRLCAVHAYAIDHGMMWEEFKFTDCVQYPLSLYKKEDGEKVLSIQDTPYLSHIPCLQHPEGEPMYKGLRKTIETLLGKDFYQQLALYAERTIK